MENVDFSRAYDYIRQRILSGEFESGRPLMADVLATKIGLSRTPVRDALRQLDADGLVTIRARVGASVRSISLSEYSEMAGLRMAMEIFAAGLAARLRNSADLREMAAAHEAVRSEIERLVTTTEFEPHIPCFTSELLVREDIRFHMAITAAARNGLIKKEILRHQLINRIVTSSAFVDPDRPAPHTRSEGAALMRATSHEHQKIYDAISRGDAAAAKDAMEQHLQEDVDSVLHRMTQRESRQLEGELSGVSRLANRSGRGAKASARAK